MQIKLIVVVFIFVGFLTSCSSSKNYTSQKNKETELPKKVKQKEQPRVYGESDLVFKEFNKKHGHNLNSHTLEYVNRYKHIAIEDMIVYKIPASITLAQGILESGSGRSQLALKSNNHFGIKCHKDWNGKKVRHDDDRRRECFRKYPHAEGSFDDHSIFLTSRSRYSALFDLREDDYKSWAKGLKKAGYATDRKYPQKLITIIEDYQLYDYDDLVLKDKKPKRSKYRKTNSKIVSINKYIIVSQGDTLYSIARNNAITVSELKQINGLTSNEINIGQKLFLSR
ncbi:MAG: glucosaminidase domain-containing protein [Bacteroidota bacterium]